MFVEGSRKCGAVDLQLRDKVAVIGGASKGLGRACAEVLAQEGVKVALCSRSASDLEKAAKEIRDATGADVLAFPGDLDRHDTVRDLIAATVDRKSTRLNSSHLVISYAVFCLKKKKAKLPSTHTLAASNSARPKPR